MSTKIETGFLNQSEYELWNNFVAKSSYGSIYSTSEYLDILCGVTDGNFKILTAKQGDEIIGGVGLYERNSSQGVYVSSRLLLYYNGIVLRDYDTKYPSQSASRHINTMTALEEALSTEDYSVIRLWNRTNFIDARVFLLKKWTTNLNYTYTVYLSDLNNLWDKVDHNLQRLINRCKKDHYEIVKNDDFKSFYDLHVKTHERKGSPIYLSYENYRLYYERLRSKNLCSLYHARAPEGQIASSQLVLTGSHPVTHTIAAATDESFMKSGVSAYLRWKVFEDLSHQGYLANDLTDAALNPVTRFKSQLGGDLQLCIRLNKTNATSLSINQKLMRKLKTILKGLI